MANMNLYHMLDDTSLSILESHKTADVKAAAGYVNGDFKNWASLVAKYGKAGLFLLSIDVLGDVKAGAQCLDVEKGDVPITSRDTIVGWVKETRANGVASKDLRYYPKVYVQESNAEIVVAMLTDAGISRDTWLLWTAHYGKGEHICGPKTCGCPVQADATQWSNSYDGVSLDISTCYGYFFSTPGDELPAAALPAIPLQDLHANASYRGVDLAWAAVNGATGYDVQLLLNGNQVAREHVTAPKVAIPVEAAKTYRWRVAALPGGSWSPEAEFATPKAPVPVSENPPVTAPVSPVETTTPVTSTPVIPQPATEPVGAPTGSKSVLVYVQEVLTPELAAKVNLPAGTILFIPHMVEAE
jgi:hypothetical protein